MYFDYTILLLVPGLILGLWAQAKVTSTFNKYSKVLTQRGIPAQDLVRQMMDRRGLSGVAIQSVAGALSDHYNPKTDVLALSESVYNSASVAAVGVAAHEAGHALQKHENYTFLSLRTVVVPVVNIGSHLAWPLFLIGLWASWNPVMYAGLILYALVTAFALITLPVEFDASRRAREMLADSGYFTQEELTGVGKVLSAAAMTYMASFISALMNLLRLLLIVQRRRR